MILLAWETICQEQIFFANNLCYIKIMVSGCFLVYFKCSLFYNIYLTIYPWMDFFSVYFVLDII